MSGADGTVNKVQVKRRIRSIVKDLENILGDLKDVAKELKEVVEDIDCLTSDLPLEERMIDSCRTDTLNSSSTSSSMERVKVYPEEALFRPAPSVLRRPGAGEHRKCPQSTRERVRFSEEVQYHTTDLLFHSEPSHPHSLMQNRIAPQKPHKTILRKSTSTTV